MSATMAIKALVLLSGGLDSAVALHWAVKKRWEVCAIEFEYYRRPQRERRACHSLLQRAGLAASTVFPVDFIREVVDLPRGVLANTFLEKAPEGYIPARNLVFYSICAYYAEILGARYIVGGHNRDDSKNFPDAGSQFFKPLNKLLERSLWSHCHFRIQVLLPLLDKGKDEIVRLGNDLRVPYELTWSCYSDAARPCGKCSSCIERRNAFDAVGIPDPLLTSS